MVQLDIEWFKRCHLAGLVRKKMLEIGSAKVQGIPNLCEIAGELGVEGALGADVDPTHEGVDIVADFALPPAAFKAQTHIGRFSTVCIFNVLEHTFDPVTVLINALSCVGEDGSLLVVAPSIWPVHNFPRDYNRLLPDWFVEFARRNDLKLLEEQFCWLSQFGVEVIRPSNMQFPTYASRASQVSKFRYWTTRIGHKALNTYGRSHWGTHSAIAAAFARR